MATAAKATDEEWGIKGRPAGRKLIAVLTVGRAIRVVAKDDIGLVLRAPCDLPAGGDQVRIFEDTEAKLAREG